jgi:carboxylesterase type B
MVWFHGGVFVWGESNHLNPAQLVQNGVIVVTINYRLGARGFLARPALAGRGGSSGNYGLMDQQAALRWVRNNITKFGGNAYKVTIFGVSAGGLSVLSQLASPSAHGLFSGAIVESGASTLTPESRDAAEVDGQAFAKRAGCADQSAACLRSLLVATNLKVSGLGVPARRRRPGPHPVAHIGLCHWPFQSRPGNRRNQPRRTASLRGHRPADRGPGDRRELPANDRSDP